MHVSTVWPYAREERLSALGNVRMAWIDALTRLEECGLVCLFGCCQVATLGIG